MRVASPRQENLSWAAIKRANPRIARTLTLARGIEGGAGRRLGRRVAYTDDPRQSTQVGPSDHRARTRSAVHSDDLELASSFLSVRFSVPWR